MRTMPIKLVAMLDDEIEHTTEAEIDLDTFEVLTDDPDFAMIYQDEGMDFYIEAADPDADDSEGESQRVFAVAVDYYDDQPNEFMLMDLDGIKNIQAIAEANPDQVTEVEDFVDDDEDIRD